MTGSLRGLRLLPVELLADCHATLASTVDVIYAMETPFPASMATRGAENAPGLPTYEETTR
jgi:hypothetical protein